MGVAKNVKSTTAVFTAILALGLVGLLFLIIFGNLSGNLGFARETLTVTNLSGAHVNITTFTIPEASNVNFSGGFTVITALANATINASTAFEIPAANITVDAAAGTIVNATIIPDPLAYNDVNLTYSYSALGTSESNTNEVIGNLTSGAVSFFSFSNVWFTLLAITLLIIIVLAVIAVVSRTSGSGDRTTS